MVICFPQIRNIPSAYNKPLTGFGSFTAAKYGTRCPAHENMYSCAGHLVPYIAAMKNPYPVTSLYRDQWVFPRLPPRAVSPNGWWQIRVGDGTQNLCILMNSNSETHMTAICDARLIYGRGWISRVFICGGTLKGYKHM